MNKPNTQVASCETTHTPTPYHIERSCGRYEIWPKDNGQVHTFVGIAQREVDAQFIVSTVNCHDDLLSACESLFEIVDTMPDLSPSEQLRLVKARQALIRATPQKAGAK